MQEKVFYVFLVWMGKSIPRASCTACAALRSRDKLSHPHQEPHERYLLCTLTFMRRLKCHKMHMQHMLRETDLSNQVKLSKPKTLVPINKKSSL